MCITSKASKAPRKLLRRTICKEHVYDSIIRYSRLVLNSLNRFFYVLVKLTVRICFQRSAHRMEEEGEDDFDPFTDESALAPKRISVFARVRPSVCARSTVLAVKAADMNSSAPLCASRHHHARR